MNSLSDTIERKFVESFDVTEWEIETDTGWVNIEKSNKTVEYDVWRLETESGKWLECADNHIVFQPRTENYGFKEIFVKDLKVGDEVIIEDQNFNTMLMYNFDVTKVKKVYKTEKKEHMYDLTVGGNNRYFMNGILSHNTLILGNTAINAVKDGKNVLYITFEIDQRELRKRIDAAYTEFSLTNIVKMRDQVKQKIKDANKNGKVGRFIIKEFPPASVSALDIESFLHTLKLKRHFEPDVVILDYLGIMVPISNNHNNSYEKGKAVCEEIRALSDRRKCPFISAVQTNRSGFGQATVDMSNIADSMGIAHTADLIISLSQPEELKENNQMKFEVIKSRISRTGAKGIVEIDYDKLKIMSQKEKVENDISDTISKGMSEIKKKSKGIT